MVLFLMSVLAQTKGGVKAYAVDRIMHKEVNTDVIIIDNCVYSKLAIEHMISQMDINLSIFSFEVHG